MPGDGPFLWLSESGPPTGFWRLPPNGMCISVFLFIEQDGKLLLGKYGDDPTWTTLTGLDEERYRVHGQGWTLPASHLILGESPRDAADRIARTVVCLADLDIEEAGVESDQYAPKRFPHLGDHYDLWLFYSAKVPPGTTVPLPPWYKELKFLDPASLDAASFARGHEDVVARYLNRKASLRRS